MGTKVRIVLYSRDEAGARTLARRAFDRIQALDEMMTDYNPESELMRVCRTAVGREVQVSPDLYKILDQARTYSSLTDGAFDASVGPLVALWRKARKDKELPGRGELEAALKMVGFRKIFLDARRRTVRLGRSGMLLDLGGIGKGYAADAAFEVLSEAGEASALVAVGGDIRTGNAPPGESGWRVGIQGMRAALEDNSTEVLIRNCGVSTSGDTEQYVQIGGVRYSHVVDPRTGIGVRDSATATVIAPKATESDALATALCILRPSEGLRVIESREGVAAMIVAQENGAHRKYLSRRMSSLLARD